MRLLAWSYLTEVGAMVIYRVHARIIRDEACRKVFHRLCREEAEHADRLLSMWGPPSRILHGLGWPCRAGAGVLGLASALAGRNAALRMDLDLERRGVSLYERSLQALVSLGAQPSAERILRVALAAEREHHDTLSRLLQSTRGS